MCPITPSEKNEKSTLPNEHLRSSGPASGFYESSPRWPDFPSLFHRPLTSFHLQAPPLSSHNGRDPRCPAATVHR